MKRLCALSVHFFPACFLRKECVSKRVAAFALVLFRRTARTGRKESNYRTHVGKFSWFRLHWYRNMVSPVSSYEGLEHNRIQVDSQWGWGGGGEGRLHCCIGVCELFRRRPEPALRLNLHTIFA